MSDHFGKISIHPAPTPPKRVLRKKSAPKHRRPNKTNPRSTGKLWVWALILGGLFVLYNIGGFWGVPYYVSTIFPKNVYEKTGFIFQTENVKFNPLTFSFNLKNSKIISPRENPSDLLIIKSVKGKLAPLSLLRNDLVSNSLTIEEMQAHITRKADGSYNFPSLLPSLNRDNNTEIMGFSDLPFHFSLNNIEVSRSKIIFSDIPAKKNHRIENIQLALPTLSNFPFQADNYIRPHFSATINDSHVELTGKAHVGDSGNEQLATDLSVDIQSFDLPFYFSYLPFDLPLDFTRGKAAGNIGLNFSPKGKKGRKLAISFNLKINDVKLSTRDSSIKLAAPTTDLSGTLYPVSKHFHLKTVSLNNPKISSLGKNATDNLHQLFSRNTKGTQAVVPEMVGTTTTSTDVDLLIVDGATLEVFKKKDSKKPHTRWNNLQFNMKQYSSLAKKEKNHKPGYFRLSGEQAGSSSSFSWQGETEPPFLLDGHLNINNIRIADLFRSLDIIPFLNSSGVADIKGRLLFAPPESETTAPSHTLKDATISIQNFLMKEGKVKILSAPLVNISNFDSSNGTTDFGNVVIKNGTLNLTNKKVPKSFSLFIENQENKYQLQSIRFDGAATFSADKDDSEKLIFPQFSLVAKELTNTKKPKKDISIVAKTKSGGSFKSEGTISLSPFKGSLKTEFSGLQPKAVFSWFSDSPFFADIKGHLSGKGDFTFPQILFAGQLTLSQTSIVLDKSTSINWQLGIFHNVNFSDNPANLSITRAEFEAPSFSWLITADDNSPVENFAGILRMASSFNLEAIEVKNGRIDIVDQRMTPVWKGEIKGLAGKITDVNSSEDSGRSQFNFTGKLDDSPFTVKAQSNLFAKEKNGISTFTLTDFPIADFHDQLAPRLDIDTSRGSLSVKLNSHWEESQLNSSGTITFSGIEAESQTSESALPLALLTNREHLFDLNFSRTQKAPISQATLFDLIIAQFQKLIVKSSVSPLLLATGNFTDLIGSEFAEFEAGRTNISEEGSKTLTLYSALLANNPNIGIAISESYNHEIDTAALQLQLQATETERVRVENKHKFKNWQTQKNDYNKAIEQKQKKMALDGKIVEQDIPPEFLLEFIPAQPQQVVVEEAMLANLAEKRSAVILQYFITQPDIDSERIKFAGGDSLAPPDDTIKNGVSFQIFPLDLH